MTAQLSDGQVREMLEALAVRGLDDWVMLDEVTDIVSKVGARNGISLNDTERIAVALRVIQEALENGLMRAGELDGDPPTFVAWKLSEEAAIDRMARKWRSAADTVALMELGWLANTPAGNELAEAALPRVSAREQWVPGSSGA